MNLPRDPVVLGITGASGAIYAVRLLQVLTARVGVHVVISEAARQVVVRELGRDYPDLTASADKWREWIRTTMFSEIPRRWGFDPDAADGSPQTECEIKLWNARQYSAGIASGSFPTAGMVICPCSMGTLASIAAGSSTNLLQRAADVHLKERRPLILVPRETPLSSIQLRNMTAVAKAGGIVLPAMPGFYHEPVSVASLVDFVVSRICDQLKIRLNLVSRWGDGTGAQGD
jgi:4-hydroxy-3-polyprenylbenzoate decarboxylase